MKISPGQCSLCKAAAHKKATLQQAVSSGLIPGKLDSSALKKNISLCTVRLMSTLEQRVRAAKTLPCGNASQVAGARIETHMAPQGQKRARLVPQLPISLILFYFHYKK